MRRRLKQMIINRRRSPRGASIPEEPTPLPPLGSAFPQKIWDDLNFSRKFENRRKTFDVVLTVLEDLKGFRVGRCQACGKAFVARGSRGAVAKGCSPACTGELQRLKPRKPANRITPYKPRLHAQLCVECGTPFQTPNTKTVCCGPACGNRRGKRLGDEGRRRNAYAKRTKVCPTCGLAFVARNPSGRERRLGKLQTFCSRPCMSSFRAERVD